MTEKTKNYSAVLQVGLMLAIILATLLLGFYMMPKSQEEHDRLLSELGTTNHGLLLTPVRQIADLSLTDDQGLPWHWADRKAKWRMLILADKSCQDECSKLLYVTRQVHIRLGKNAHRFERFLLATEGEIEPELQRILASEHPYLKVLRSNEADITKWLENTNSPWKPGQTGVILVDPAGVAMMTYNVGNGGNEMLEDLNHLLKYSAE